MLSTLSANMLNLVTVTLKCGCVDAQADLDIHCLHVECDKWCLRRDQARCTIHQCIAAAVIVAARISQLFYINKPK